jgi:hypothetical protein
MRRERIYGFSRFWKKVARGGENLTRLFLPVGKIKKSF